MSSIAQYKEALKRERANLRKIKEENEKLKQELEKVSRRVYNLQKAMLEGNPLTSKKKWYQFWK